MPGPALGILLPLTPAASADTLAQLAGRLLPWVGPQSLMIAIMLGAVGTLHSRYENDIRELTRQLTLQAAGPRLLSARDCRAR